MLKDASSSMLEDIVAQPSSEHEAESHEIEDEPEVPELRQTEPVGLKPEGLEPVLDDESSTINDLVKEQETELDFATKVLWELAKDASQLVIDKKMTEDAPEIDAEEVQQG
ncbi:hypothetical protein KAV47_06510 [Candidatus Bathyarchaeota archaeon]|nr:hypothetical protein [Candidatus Bathyarchaeota archaeon]